MTRINCHCTRILQSPNSIIRTCCVRASADKLITRTSISAARANFSAFHPVRIIMQRTQYVKNELQKRECALWRCMPLFVQNSTPITFLHVLNHLCPTPLYLPTTTQVITYILNMIQPTAPLPPPLLPTMTLYPPSFSNLHTYINSTSMPITFLSKHLAVYDPKVELQIFQ